MGEDTATPRPQCEFCTRKHVSKAMAQLQEALMGYPHHQDLAIGEIAEAECECVGIWPDIANILRKTRKKMDADLGYIPNLLPLMLEIRRRIEAFGHHTRCASCSVELSKEDRIAMRIALSMMD